MTAPTAPDTTCEIAGCQRPVVLLNGKRDTRCEVHRPKPPGQIDLSLTKDDYRAAYRCEEHAWSGEDGPCPTCSSMPNHAKPSETERVSYGPQHAFFEQLEEHLRLLPLNLEKPADVEHARRLWTRVLNWYFWSYTKDEAKRGESPWQVLTVADRRYCNDDELDTAQALFETVDVLPFRALLNLVRDVASELGLSAAASASDIRRALRAARMARLASERTEGDEP